MELTQKERRDLINDITTNVIRVLEKRKKLVKEEDEWIDSKEAAAIIGVSVSRLRKIKDRFPHTKVGNNAQGQLRFLKSGLIEKYAKGD